MSIKSHPEYRDEYENLTYVLRYLREFFEKSRGLKETIDKSVAYSLKHFNADNAEQFTDLVLNMDRQSYLDLNVKNASRALLKPYFARVDFDSEDEGLKKLYIGKMGLLRDEDNTPLIIDWRAPVSNLYYEERIGRASYDCPDGHIEGEITLKRQYVIENGKLNDFFDIDITTNDEFLQAALGESKDNRLKDIVTTIQAEQNRIIRAGIEKPLIVQGAAGGGKTTIALHRIAYLLYNYDKTLLPKNFMILAPNRFFLSYISDVLPDLGVENVNQTTFQDFALSIIDEKLNVSSDVKKLSFMLESGDPKLTNTLKYISKAKSSMQFKKIIEKYFEYLTLRVVLPQEDFTLDNHVLFPQSEVKNLLCNYYDYLPLARRIAEIKKYLVSSLKRKKPQILADIDSFYEKEKENVKREMEDSPERRKKITLLLDERDMCIKAIEKKSKTLIRGYMDKFKLKKVSEYYSDLFNGLLYEMYGGLIENIGLLQKHTRSLLDAGMIETEDLAPIMYLKYKIYGLDERFDIKHVVVDEAQDVSLFQFSVLREILGTTSFTILGDLSQGIYSYKGITNWVDIEKNIFYKNGADFATLEQSYRTTVEIMDAANYVISRLKLDVPFAKPVIRHGTPVVFETAETAELTAGRIINKIEELTQKAYKSIAIICKTLDGCEVLSTHLKGIKFNLITGKEDEFYSGTVLIPSYLVKGLEFDAVIIADAGIGEYKDNETDIKLLYVAMTRALHELAVYSTNGLSVLLPETDENWRCMDDNI